MRDDHMAGVSLYGYQEEALGKMHNGCILNGGVGSGKSRTSLAYYYTLMGGRINTKNYVRMTNPVDLYIITTARKRDTCEWEGELANYYMSTDPNVSLYKNHICVDSWNNIKKYEAVIGAFFIFDEQRVVGYGAWTKAFLKITKRNRWILLSATPGDTWSDYIPVFIANGFYRNKTDFNYQHCIFSRYSKYPKIERYINTGRLLKLRDNILVDMKFDRQTIRHEETILVNYDYRLYDSTYKLRWNPYKNEPIEDAGNLCLVLRRIVNSDVSRLEAVLSILVQHPKAIIFYSYDYELELLRSLLDTNEWPYSEWNGHKHQHILEGDKWAYLVEYVAGCEGWNCTTTDTVIFYSQNYSYKVMQQAMGRIDRLNTPYIDLYYYNLKSKAKIDVAISQSLRRKKKFNERKFAPEFAKVEAPKELTA